MRRTQIEPHFPVTLGYSVRAPNLVAPESSPHRNNGQLGEDDSTTDSSGHLLGTLHSQTNMAVVVTDSYESLEPSPLPRPGLLLHRHDLQHLVLEGGADEHVDDLVLLDRQREKVDLLQTLDFPILNKTTKLCYRNPILLFFPSSTTTSTVTTSGRSLVRHVLY